MTNHWLNRLVKLQQKYTQVMRGRYGRFDDLNKLLLLVWLLVSIVSRLLPFHLGTIIEGLLLGLMFYRIFSRRIVVRSNENQKFLQKLVSWKRFFNRRKNSYRYFNCPSCSQKMRAPRGRGKIKVTCHNCHAQFVKKV